MCEVWSVNLYFYFFKTNFQPIKKRSRFAFHQYNDVFLRSLNSNFLFCVRRTERFNLMSLNVMATNKKIIRKHIHVDVRFRNTALFYSGLKMPYLKVILDGLGTNHILWFTFGEKWLLMKTVAKNASGVIWIVCRREIPECLPHLYSLVVSFHT